MTLKIKNFNIGGLMIDVFSRYMEVVPIKNKK